MQHNLFYRNMSRKLSSKGNAIIIFYIFFFQRLQNKMRTLSNWYVTRGQWAKSLTWGTVSIDKHYDNAIMFIKEKQSLSPFFENWLVVCCTDWNSIHPRPFCNWNWSSGYGEEDLFMLYCNFLPLENTAWPFIFINSLYLKTLCTKFGWNWACCSGEDSF